MTIFGEWKRSLLIFISKIVVLAIIVGLAYLYVVPDVKQTWNNVKELIDDTAVLARYIREKPEGAGEFIDNAMVLTKRLRHLSDTIHQTVSIENEIDFYEFLQDIYILTERLKQDSDIMRLYMLGYPEDKIRGMSTKEIEAKEKKANILIASPSMELFRLHNAIRNELNIMNKSMLTMSHSMGNTMGRMGSWMP